MEEVDILFVFRLVLHRMAWKTKYWFPLRLVCRSTREWSDSRYLDVHRQFYATDPFMKGIALQRNFIDHPLEWGKFLLNTSTLSSTIAPLLFCGEYYDTIWLIATENYSSSAKNNDNTISKSRILKEYVPFRHKLLSPDLFIDSSYFVTINTKSTRILFHDKLPNKTFYFSQFKDILNWNLSIGHTRWLKFCSYYFHLKKDKFGELYLLVELELLFPETFQSYAYLNSRIIIETNWTFLVWSSRFCDHQSLQWLISYIKDSPQYDYSKILDHLGRGYFCHIYMEPFQPPTKIELNDSYDEDDNYNNNKKKKKRLIPNPSSIEHQLHCELNLYLENPQHLSKCNCIRDIL